MDHRKVKDDRSEQKSKKDELEEEKRPIIIEDDEGMLLERESRRKPEERAERTGIKDGEKIEKLYGVAPVPQSLEGLPKLRIKKIDFWRKVTRQEPQWIVKKHEIYLNWKMYTPMLRYEQWRCPSGGYCGKKLEVELAIAAATDRIDGEERKFWFKEGT